MEFMPLLTEVFRWAHIVAGILWVGLTFFFSFVFLRFAPAMDEAMRRRVMTEMIPRGLYLLRWSALWTWVVGLLLMMLVFYHGGSMFESGGWRPASVLMLVVVYVGGFAAYEGLARSPLSNNSSAFAAVCFILIAVVVLLMKEVAGFGYRAYVVHTGAMFGTIMTANVWMTIWPVQRKFINAFRKGDAPGIGSLDEAVKRAKHNTYLSVPLLYTMIGLHTSVTSAATSIVYLLAAVFIGWCAVAFLFRVSAKER